MLKTAEIGKAIATGLMVRLGTAVSVWLLSHGVPEDLADQIVQIIAVVIALGFDLGLSFLLRERGEK